MVRVDDLGLFVRTAALGSFSNAAREADLLPGQVAAAVARLERELDLRLFVRSTRSLRLTAEGALYLPYAQEVLAALSEGQARVRGEDAELRGVLQVAAPSDLGRHVLLPWLSEFRRAHPKLQLRLHLSDQVADVFRDPVDIAFRLGRFDNASYVALPLLPGNRRVLAAAPDYLAQHGTPDSLEALKDHHCLLYQLAGALTTAGTSRWTGAGWWCRCAATWSATMPTWCGAGPWPAKASCSSRGWICAPTCVPGACRCCWAAPATACR